MIDLNILTLRVNKDKPLFEKSCFVQRQITSNTS